MVEALYSVGMFYFRYFVDIFIYSVQSILTEAL